MKVLSHHIYEYLKGLRNLVLHTMDSKYRDIAQAKLERYNITYLIQIVSPNKINIFFGADECIEIIREFNNRELNKLSAEEDFILGTMLGYDKVKQCKRYMKMKLAEKRQVCCA